MLASECTFYDDAHSKRLYPKDPTGRRFTEYFNHGWHFIYAPLPACGEKPQWRTELRYPLEPRNLWSRYQDTNLLVGLRFDEYTRYLLLDIDRHSDNHPDNNPQHYQHILHLLEEEMGLCRSVCVRSSESDGIHLYYFLPYPVPCFRLAAAVRHVLEKADYHVRGGQLELFPNTKPYGEKVITDYNAHRLPLQEGSFLLDDDFHPISNSVETLLNWADQTARAQDMETLTTAIARTPKTYQRKPRRTQDDDNQEFRRDVREIMHEGWTGYGQTNDMLITIAKHGIIFLKLWGENLTTYIRDTAIATPGYREWSCHQHEIDKRSQEVARSAERYYTRLHSRKPPRTKTYKQNFYGGEEDITNVIPFLPQQQLHEETLERIAATVATLKAEGTFPSGAYLRTKAIRAKSLAVFGIGVSPTTLYKEEYKPLWHPAYEETPVVPTTADIPQITSDFTIAQYEILPDPWLEKMEPVNSSAASNSESLHHLANEGIYIQAWEPRLDGAEIPSCELDSLSKSGIISEDEHLQNHSSDTDSTHPTILHISSLSNTIHSVPLNSSSDEYSEEFSSIHSIHKNSKYPLLPAARPENREILNKSCLSMPETPTSSDVASHESMVCPSNSSTDSKIDSNCAEGSPSAWSTSPSAPGSVRQEIIFPGETEPEFPISSSLVDSVPIPETGVFVAGESPPVGASQPLVEATDSEDVPVPPAPTYTPEQYREAIRLRLQAMPQAKRWVRIFSDTEGIALLPMQRQQMEKFLQYHLMLASPSPILQQEAEAWFAAHGDITADVRAFEVFWQYCQKLL